MTTSTDELVSTAKEFFSDYINDKSVIINRLNFEIAEHLPYELYSLIDGQSKMMEIEYKRYIVGVITNNKKLRVSALKRLKELKEKIIPSLKSFKKILFDVNIRKD